MWWWVEGMQVADSLWREISGLLGDRVEELLLEVDKVADNL